jgi:hypothetical protein
MRILSRVCLVLGFLGMLAGFAAGTAWFFMQPGPGVLAYTLVTKPSLMTFAHKAYANPAAASGKYWLSKLMLENTGDSPVTHIKVSYHLGDYLPWTTPDDVPEILPGQSAVLANYPKLSSSVTQIRATTPATLEVKIEWMAGDKHEERVEKRELQLRGATEIEYTSLPANEIVGFYDMFDNSELCAAFVTDEDEVVKNYLGKISETVGGIDVPSDFKSLAKLVASVYNFECATGMTYAAGKGDVQEIGGGSGSKVQTVVQSVRLPRDVIYQNSGLCIELAILMSTVCRAAGAKAYLILIPGHCYPCLEAGNGDRLVIETTGVGGDQLGGTLTFEQAVKVGMAELKQVLSGDKPGIIIDVAKEQGKGLRPPELEHADIAGLTKILNDRIAAARRSEAPPPQPQPAAPVPAPPQPQPQPQPSSGNYTLFNDRIGVVRLGYPATWLVDGAKIQNLQRTTPWITFFCANPADQTEIGVYEFGSPDSDACCKALLGYCQASGRRMAFGGPRGVKVSGLEGVARPFSLTGQATWTGEVFLIRTSRGTVGLSFCSPPGAQQAGQQAFYEVLKRVTINPN